MTEALSAAKCVVIVGAVPPPHGGQAALLQLVVASAPNEAQLIHVDTKFSVSSQDRGRLQPRKMRALFEVILRILLARLRGGRVLYYCPSGNEFGPVLRDALVLGTTRWMFERTIYHFHAGGLSTLLSRLPRPVQATLRLGLGSPTVAIQLSRNSPPDALALRAASIRFIANGCAPVLDGSATNHKRKEGGATRLLYVGVLGKDKGLYRLLALLEQLVHANLNIVLMLAGSFESDRDRQNLQLWMSEHVELARRVSHLGSVAGQEKVAAYRAADIFMYLSTFPHENQPLAIVEAMSAGLPVVASDWRALPSLVSTAVTGFIVNADDERAIFTTVSGLCADPGLRLSLGRAGRCRYDDYHTEERFTEAVWSVILERGWLGDPPEVPA